MALDFNKESNPLTLTIGIELENLKNALQRFNEVGESRSGIDNRFIQSLQDNSIGVDIYSSVARAHKTFSTLVNSFTNVAIYYHLKKLAEGKGVDFGSVSSPLNFCREGYVEYCTQNSIEIDEDLQDQAGSKLLRRELAQELFDDDVAKIIYGFAPLHHDVNSQVFASGRNEGRFSHLMVPYLLGYEELAGFNFSKENLSSVLYSQHSCAVDAIPSDVVYAIFQLERNALAYLSQFRTVPRSSRKIQTTLLQNKDGELAIKVTQPLFSQESYKEEKPSYGQNIVLNIEKKMTENERSLGRHFVFGPHSGYGLKVAQTLIGRRRGKIEPRSYGNTLEMRIIVPM